MTISDSLAKTLIDLLRIHSVTGSEKECCDHVEKEIKLRTKMPFMRVRNSIVVGEKERIGNKPRVALLGHLDTVPGDGTGDRVKQAGDKITGLGASDMKAGVAVMLELLRDGVVENTSYDVVHIYYESEEGPFANNGLHKLFQEFEWLKNIDFAFVLEPTNNDVHLGCVGISSASVKFRGKRAHNARPWTGENAIHKAAPFLTRISKLEPKTIKFGELEFKEVSTITLAHGGIAVNVVPDLFEVTANLRVPPGKAMSTAQEEFLQLVNGDADVEFFNIHPAGPVPANNSIYAEFKKRYGLKEEPKQAYTDVGLLASHGIDAVNYGPGLTDQAHQTAEYVLLSDTVKVFEVLREFLSGM